MDAIQILESANTFHMIAGIAIDSLCVEKDSKTVAKIQEEYRKKLWEIDTDDENTQAELDALWMSQWEEHFELHLPMIVNLAFASELYIKAMLAFSNISYNFRGSAGHNLEQLFNQLPSAVKKNVMDYVLGNSHTLNFNFDTFLHSIATAFNDWRYWFENKDEETDLQMDMLSLFHFVAALNFQAEEMITPNHS